MVKKLFLTPGSGFTAADGFELRMWERELELPAKGKRKAGADATQVSPAGLQIVPPRISLHLRHRRCRQLHSRSSSPSRCRPQTTKALYRRPYLINTTTLVVITSQHKAWMDSAGMCMWVDVQLGPWAKRRTGRALVVWDNCGPHKVPAVKAVFMEWRIATEELPPKMTDILQARALLRIRHRRKFLPHSSIPARQVMDLIVNGPVKSGIRAGRCENLFSYFQNWKIERLKAAAAKPPLPLPKFSPPKPTVLDGLKMVEKVCADTFSKASFKEKMRTCFVQVGLVKDESGEFVKYTKHDRKGTLAFKAVGLAELPSLGETAAEVEVLSRAEADENEDDFFWEGATEMGSPPASDDDDDDDDGDDGDDGEAGPSGTN